MGGHKQTSAKQRVLLKIECAAHQEFNNNFYKLNAQKKIDSNQDVFFRDSKFEVVPIDEGLPSYILENREKFGHLIKE